ncbi:MAG: Zinc/iron permease [Parcubacteria group bacterium GW2011_GWA2_36_10]|nr:MAG: Zinc/iron permease [Parcubacteria group bacterium GW2011_GWA2_36_10]
MLLNIILATVLVSAISLIGILLIFNRPVKEKFLRILISVSAGSLLSVVFLDLLPEAIEADLYAPNLIFGVVLISIIFFFLFERVLHWHHCRCEYHHGEVNPKQHLAYINLIGDAVHNIVDGFLIAASFMLDLQTGIVVTAAVILHEIPQEVSDFGVLLYAGLSKAKALLANLLVALSAVMGAIIFYFFGQSFEQAVPLMVAFAAGNFIYLSMSDLIPELHHEKEPKAILKNSLWLLFGVLIVYFLILILPHT